MDNFEKNYEKAVDKGLNAVEKVAGVANRAYIGCAFIVANLFLRGLLFVGGAYVGYASWQLEQNGEETTGIVVEMEESSSAESGCCVYSPVIEFVAGGQTFSFDGGNASYPPAYEVGEEVSVLYDPADPNTAQINKWSERWLFPIIIIPAMLFAALLVSFFLIRAFWRNDPIHT